MAFESALVSFVSPVDDGGSTIIGYTVTSTPGNITASGISSPINVPGLTNGVSYTFTVHANNANGAGPESAASNAVIPGPSDTFTGKLVDVPISTLGTSGLTLRQITPVDVPISTLGTSGLTLRQITPVDVPISTLGTSGLTLRQITPVDVPVTLT